MRACGAEAALKGNTFTVDALVTAMEELQHDISPGNTPGLCLLRIATAFSVRQWHEAERKASAKLTSPWQVNAQGSCCRLLLCC